MLTYENKRWGVSYISFMGSSAEEMAPVVECLAGH